MRIRDRELLVILKDWSKDLQISNGTKKAIRECIQIINEEVYGRNILDPEKVIEDLVSFEPQKDDQGNVIPCKCF